MSPDAVLVVPKDRKKKRRVVGAKHLVAQPWEADSLIPKLKTTHISRHSNHDVSCETRILAISHRRRVASQARAAVTMLWNTT